MGLNKYRLVAFTLLPRVAILVAYLWYFTAGLWIRLPDANSTALYDQLAEALMHGKTYLLNPPSPELLALPNPYVVGQRRDVPYVGDVSLYDGRYYLYWGPVPAWILVAFKAIVYPGPIGDAFLAGVFLVGVFLVLSSLLEHIWLKYFNHLPGYSLAASILMVGLLPPLTWMINSPLIYEAALASASLFFLAGVYTAFRVLSRQPDGGLGLGVAGLFWALAIGCQFTQIVPIGAALVITTWWQGRSAREAANGARLKASIVGMWFFPAIMLVGLGWYNYSRFGSALEFGYRYQLALIDLHRNYNRIFGPVFIIPNLYNYLVNPFLVRPEFPFLLPKHGSALDWLPFRLLHLYRTETITGLLLSSPVLVYSSIPAMVELAGLRMRGLRRWLKESREEPIHWLHWIALGTILGNLPVLLLFFYSAPRYLMAALPMVSMLTVMGLLRILDRRMEAAPRRSASILVAAVLSVWSVLATSLLAISSSQDRFLNGNPGFIQLINRLLFGP